MKKHTERSRYQRWEKSKVRTDYAESRALYVQKQREATERRQRINPRLVMTDPESFFNEQNETT